MPWHQATPRLLLLSLLRATFLMMVLAACLESGAAGGEAAKVPKGAAGADTGVHTAVGAVASFYTPRLPASMTNWMYRSTGRWPPFAARDVSVSVAQRYWSRADLSSALLAPGLAQFGPVLDRLQRGLPLHVAALGSSVTFMGGCYHSTTMELQRQVRRLPDIYHVPAQLCHVKGGMAGWLNAAMQQVNATWPHAGHVLINAGRSGQALSAFARSCVVEDELPAPAHLYLVENLDFLSSAADVESVLWSIYRVASRAGQPRPAVVLLNSLALQNFNGSGDPASRECIFNSSLCEERCGPRPDGSAGFRSVVWGPDYAEMRHRDEHDMAAQLSRHYGLTVVSIFQLMRAMMLEGMHTALRWSECRLLTSLTRDIIHPTWLGQVMLADLLINVLRMAEVHAHHHPRAVPPPLPARPLLGGSLLRVYCPLVDTARYDQEAVVLQAGVQLPANTGWKMERMYNHAQHGLMYGPAFTAERPGALLAWKMTGEAAAALFRSGGGSGMELSVFIVRSKGMGFLRVRCEGDCGCTPLEANAHDKRGFTYPWPERTQLTPAPAHGAVAAAASELQRPGAGGSSRGAAPGEAAGRSSSSDGSVEGSGGNCTLVLEVLANSTSGSHRMQLHFEGVVLAAYEGPEAYESMRFVPWGGFGSGSAQPGLSGGSVPGAT